MSSSPFSEPSVHFVLQREHDTSATASSSTDLGFKTQVEPTPCSQHDIISQSPINETQTRVSAHRHSILPRSSHKPSTEAPLSHYSEDHNEQPGDYEQRRSVRSSSIPLRKCSVARSSRVNVEAEWVAAGDSPPLDDAPTRELFNVVLNLLNEGIELEVLLEVVDQAASFYDHHRKLDQSNPTSPKRRTRELITETIEQDCDLGDHATEGARVTDSISGSQYTTRSLSQDTAGSRLLDEVDATSNTLDTISEGSIQAWYEEHKKGDLFPGTMPALEEAAWESHPGPRVKTRKALAVDNEFQFINAFPAWFFRANEFQEPAIRLLELARDTLEVSQKIRGRITNDKQTWQIMYNIIANMLFFGLEPLYSTVKAISQPSGDDIRAAKASRPGTVTASRSATTHAVLDVSIEEEELGNFTDSMCSWGAEDNISPLRWVYSYYDKLQTVRQYDRMTNPDNQERTMALLRMKGIHPEQGKNAVSTAILLYICQQMRLRKKEIPKKIRHLSAQIGGFRTVCALVDAFDEGVLVLLGKNPQRLFNMVKRAKPSRLERLKEVAMSLADADRDKHNGTLHKMFSDLREKVLVPVLQLREYGNTDGWLVDCPEEVSFDRLEAGEGVSFFLNRIRKVNTGSHSIAVQREESRKRRVSHENSEEAAEGRSRKNKRNKAELRA